MPLSDGAIMGLDWGNIPVWVGVILTSASVGIAARTYVLNSRRAIREQASQVTVELHVPEIAPDILHTVEVTNHSAASIWRVRLEVHRFTTVEYSPREAVVRPGDSLIFTTEPFWWEKFAPGSASGAMRAPVYGKDTSGGDPARVYWFHRLELGLADAAVSGAFTNFARRSSRSESGTGSGIDRVHISPQSRCNTAIVRIESD
jgi:hypothetical protein